MSLSYTHGREFVTDMRPLLEYGDTHLISRHVCQFWSHEKLIGLLTCGHEEAIKSSLFCLSLVGTMSESAIIAPLLNDDDAPVAGMAEYAMWSIWFRAGDDKSNADLLEAVRLISQNKLNQGIHLLDKIVLRAPDFAEAFNQRAIAYFLQEDYLHAMADCEATLRLNPHHFGALAGLGHCYTAAGQLEKALEAYCYSLQLHPRLEGLRQSIQQIRKNLHGSAKISKTQVPIPPSPSSQKIDVRPE